MFVFASCGSGTGEKAPAKEASGQAEVPEPAPKEPGPSSGLKSKRLEYVLLNGLPQEYGNVTSPLPSGDAEALKAGALLYKKKCAMCHGKKGKGDGPGGKGLKPRPTDLTALVKEEAVTDAYLFWAITKGGRPIKTAMPGFGKLGEDDRWKLVLYVRSWQGL